jgi:hypothetical protein
MSISFIQDDKDVKYEVEYTETNKQKPEKKRKIISKNKIKRSESIEKSCILEWINTFTKRDNNTNALHVIEILINYFNLKKPEVESILIEDEEIKETIPEIIYPIEDLKINTKERNEVKYERIKNLTDEDINNILIIYNFNNNFKEELKLEGLELTKVFKIILEEKGHELNEISERLIKSILDFIIEGKTRVIKLIQKEYKHKSRKNFTKMNEIIKSNYNLVLFNYLKLYSSYISNNNQTIQNSFQEKKIEFINLNSQVEEIENFNQKIDDEKMDIEKIENVNEINIEKMDNENVNNKIENDKEIENFNIKNKIKMEIENVKKIKNEIKINTEINEKYDLTILNFYYDNQTEFKNIKFDKKIKLLILLINNVYGTLGFKDIIENIINKERDLKFKLNEEIEMNQNYIKGFTTKKTDIFEKMKTQKLTNEKQSKFFENEVKNLDYDIERFNNNIKNLHTNFEIDLKKSNNTSIRITPLGMDRYWNKYWLFERFLFIEFNSAFNETLQTNHNKNEKISKNWGYLDKTYLELLTSSLDTRGIRESNLYTNIQNIKNLDFDFNSVIQKSQNQNTHFDMFTIENL